jgi:tetratricopeptide (TPR) repeat protein
MVLCEQGKDIDQAIAVLQKELSGGAPSNPIYHNLAMCYYWKQDYQKSQEYCRKALAAGEDETTLLLHAKNYHALKQLDKAIEWFGKALTFIESQQPTFSIASEAKLESVSFARPEWIENKRKEIFIGVIHCYLDMGDFASAKSWHQKARELWPRDVTVANMANIISSLSNSGAQAQKSLKESEVLRDRLSSSSRISRVARRVAAKVVKLQNPQESFEPETEEDWAIVEGMLHNLAVSLKEEASPDDSKLFPLIRKELAQLFTEADGLTIEFLTTGEFLYRIHIESQMDYSPVLMEYCKALENELAVLLSQRGLLQQNSKYTFGDLLFILKKAEPGNNLTGSLDMLLRYRNMAAHNKRITLAMVEEIRDGIWHKGWLTALLR